VSPGQTISVREDWVLVSDVNERERDLVGIGGKDVILYISRH
jgi:hypothetical protein